MPDPRNAKPDTRNEEHPYRAYHPNPEYRAPSTEHRAPSTDPPPAPMEQVSVLSSGCVIEEGRHDDLLARGGVYADLVQKQTLGGDGGDGGDGVGDGVGEDECAPKPNTWNANPEPDSPARTARKPSPPRALAPESNNPWNP